LLFEKRDVSESPDVVGCSLDCKRRTSSSTVPENRVTSANGAKKPRRQGSEQRGAGQVRSSLKALWLDGTSAGHIVFSLLGRVRRLKLSRLTLFRENPTSTLDHRPPRVLVYLQGESCEQSSSHGANMARNQSPSPAELMITGRSLSPPPVPQSKRDKRRTMLGDRLTDMVASFNANLRPHYEAQANAIQVDIGLILRADPYKNKPLEDDADEISNLIQNAVAGSAAAAGKPIPDPMPRATSLQMLGNSTLSLCMRSIMRWRRGT